jgi:hypothetical protein
LTDRNTPQRSATGENGWLVDFDSTRFFATNEADATVGRVKEKTWLQVLMDGKAIYSKVYEFTNTPPDVRYFSIVSSAIVRGLYLADCRD